MLIPNELYNSLQGLSTSLNNVLKYPYISSNDKKLELFLYTLEKRRFEIYEQVRFFNDTNPEDGLIHGGVIRDDNLFNCCYMVQGFYSDIPHIEVSVLEADKIIKFIDNELPNITK